MIFQTQLKHCFTKYECQLQGWVAWIQISTWLALHWTDFGACPAVSSAEKGCTEIFHENRDRHWKPTGTPPAPDLPSRAESKATSSVLQFVKAEQDTLLPWNREERVEEADQQPQFPVILSRIHGAEVLVRGLCYQSWDSTTCTSNITEAKINTNIKIPQTRSENVLWGNEHIEIKDFSHNFQIIQQVRKNIEMAHRWLCKLVSGTSHYTSPSI